MPADDNDGVFPLGRPRRGAAMKASMTFADQMASSSPVHGGSDENSEMSSEPSSTDEDASKPEDVNGKGKGKAKEPPPSRAAVLSPGEGRGRAVIRTYMGKGKRSLGASSSKPASSSPLPSVTIARRSLTPQSPLTPLTPTPGARVTSPRKRAVRSADVSTPSKRQRLSKGNVVEDDESPTNRSTLKRKASTKVIAGSSAQASLPALPLSRGKSKSATGNDYAASEDNWSLEKLEKLVWVRVNQRGEVVSDEAHREQAYWWPAKITSDDTTVIPLQVALFNPPSTASDHVLTIPSPSSFNICSHTTVGGRQRFNISNFASLPISNAPTDSSRKRIKAAVEARWKLAMEQMDHEDANLNDGLPSSISALLSQTPGSPKRRIRVSEAEKPSFKGKSQASFVNALRDSWSPPPPDSLLSIPGELVLAREKRKYTEYWPAKILQYVWPTKPSEQGKYLLHFLDKKEHAVSRDMFYTSEQDEFAACKMGMFDSWMQETEDDDENENTWEYIALDDRALSPEPLNPPPACTEFSELSIPQQFAYVKPILSMILNEHYEPTRERHNAFIKGGQHRVNVCKSAGARGDLKSEEVNELTARLCRWALRGERFAKTVDDGKEEGTLKRTEAAHAPATAPSSPQTPRAQSVVRKSTIKANDIPNSGDDLSVREGSTEPELRSCEPVQNSSPLSQTEAPPSSLVTSTDFKSSPTERESSPVEAMRIGVETSSESMGRPSSAQAAEGARKELLRGNPAQLQRQTGCHAYEQLSGTERLDYCLSILLPEAISQLLLWRSGERTSLSTLAPEEEGQLHDRGQEKAREVDFVHAIVRLRRIKEKELKIPSQLDARSKTHQSTAGSRTRSRRGTGAG